MLCFQVGGVLGPDHGEQVNIHSPVFALFHKSEHFPFPGVQLHPHHCHAAEEQGSPQHRVGGVAGIGGFVLGILDVSADRAGIIRAEGMDTQTKELLAQVKGAGAIDTHLFIVVVLVPEPIGLLAGVDRTLYTQTIRSPFISRSAMKSILNLFASICDVFYSTTIRKHRIITVKASRRILSKFGRFY